MANALSDVLKYRVVLLGPDRKARLSAFSNEFHARVGDLGLDAAQHACVEDYLHSENSFETGINAVVWCGNSSQCSAEELEELEELMNSGVSIFTAVESLDDYTEQVPDLLHPLNGCTWENLHQLVTSILETFGLLRIGKRVFISYRRKESQAVANQLFEQLQHRGYRTFLDTASIDPGQAVQDQLKAQLLDMDVVVLLHSKGALDSKWVMEEVLDAQHRGTEVFDLLWPNATPARELSLAISERLESTNFQNPSAPDPATHRLEDGFLGNFLVLIERARIRSVRTRRDRLLRQMAEDAKLAGQRFRYFATGSRDITSMPFAGYGTPETAGISRLAIISHGTPNAVDLQKIESAAEKNDGGSLPASVVYDEFGLLEEQAKHLMWLNSLSNLKGAQFLPLSRHLRWLETDDIR